MENRSTNLRRCACFGWVSMLAVLQVMTLAADPEEAQTAAPEPALCISLRTQTRPAVNGNSDDRCWQLARTIEGFVLNTEPQPAKVPTKVRLAWDAQCFYLLWECSEPNMEELVAKQTVRDGNVWEDDSVEVYVDPSHSHSAYFNFTFNALGTLYDSRRPAGAKDEVSAWNGNIQVKATRADNGWNVEAAIPFKALGIRPPKGGEVWSLNLCRTRPAKQRGQETHAERQPTEYSCWVCPFGGFATPARFGHVIFLQTLNLAAVEKARLAIAEEDAKLRTAHTKQKEDAMEVAMETVLKAKKPRGMTGIYNAEDVARAKRNIAKYDWAKRLFQQVKSGADFWVAKSDEELYGFVPAENPRALVVSYNYGCPIHGGYYSTLQAAFDTPNRWLCPTGGEWWYPGLKVKNPGTGEEVAVEDDGHGWVAPKGFPHEGARYWFVAAYRLYRLGVLYARPYAPTVSGKWVPNCLESLALTYSLTGDRRYAHKALLLLNRMAELYRTFDGICDIGSRKTHISEISTTETWYIESMVRAYDLCFDAVAGDTELVRFFASKGNTDHNGDGNADTADLHYNIQRNLFGPIYELVTRLVREERADWQVDYVKNYVQLAAMLGDGEMMRQALDGPRGLFDEMINAFFRDGKHWYCSLGYSIGNVTNFARIAEEAHGFCDGKVHRKPLDPYHDRRSRFGDLLSFLREVDCDGHVPPMGDCGWGRERSLRPAYSSLDEIGLVRLPEHSDEYRQRLFVTCEGKVNDRRSDWWILFHADDFDSTGLKDAALSSRSHLFPASQIAILRVGEKSETRKHVGLHFCRGTASHAHYDNLALCIAAFGWGLTTDVTYWCDAHPKHGESWLRHAASHCLVVPDGRNQVIATGELHAYYDMPGMRIADASAEDAYPGLSLYRRSVLVIPVHPTGRSEVRNPKSEMVDDAYIVDIFRVKGGKLTHDYLYHALGGNEGQNFALDFGRVAVTLTRQAEGSLAGPNVAYATTPGYGFIRDVEHTQVNNAFTARWRVGDPQDTGLRLWVPQPVGGRELFVGRGEGYGVFGHSPLDRRIVLREKVTEGQASTFVTVLEPFQGKSFIDSVECLNVEDNRAHAVGLCIRCGGRTDYIFNSLDPEVVMRAALNDNQFEFAGGTARVSVDESGRVSSWLAGASRLKWQKGGVDLETTATITGTIADVDIEHNAVTVSVGSSMPTGNKLKDSVMLVTSPKVPRAVPAAFVIGSVTATAKPRPSGSGHVGGRYRVSFADPTTLLIARAPVTAVHPAENAISIDAGTITRQAKRLLNGKRALAKGKRLLLIEDLDGEKVRFADSGAAAAFQVGNVTDFYELGPGDGFEVGCVLEKAQ